MSSTDFPEPPEEFLHYPAGSVIALMNDGDAVVDKDDKADAERILGEHGAVHIVYMGKATYETLDP